MRVLALQYKPKFGQKEVNLTALAEILDGINMEGIDVIALHKFFSTGFPNSKEDVMNWVEPILGPTTDRLGDIAKKYKAYIVGGTIIEESGQKIYETCPVFGRNGELIGKYRRMHIAGHHASIGMVDGMPEDMPVFKTDKAIIGVFIQYDCLIPEIPRVLALKGATVLFWLGAVDYQRINVYNELLDSHALANEVYIVAVGEAGPDNIRKYTFFGNSRIINPIGETVHSAGTFYSQDFQNHMVMGDLNLEFLEKHRQRPESIWKNRRPHVYSLLCEKAKPF